MCTVSMVIKDWQEGPNRIPDFTPWQRLPPVITPELAQQMLEVLRRLDAIDKRLNALDCALKEPEKAKIVRKLKRRAQSAHRSGKGEA
jgi:hypothetical protein